MADVKISELPALTSSDGAEELVVNDSGTTKKITGTNLLAGYVSKNSTTGAASMPSGTTAQRPTGALGMFRHNTTLDQFEGYNDGEWGALAGGGELSKITYEYIATAGQTSFTGSDLNGNTLSYTVGSIIVSYGGLDLAFSDYTATNGSSITLADGAVVGKIVRIVAFTTFAVADTYTQSQANTLLAAKAPIASPSFTGNVGVGTASPSARFEVEDNGSSTGGVIMKVTQDDQGSHYGMSVGNDAYSTVDTDGFVVYQMNNGHTYLYNGGVSVPNIGMPVSGGITFGNDTAAANTLSDYETGTWTPIDSSGAGLTLSVSGANYVKVGTLCHVSVYLNFPNNSNGLGVRIGGLPFTAKNNQNYNYLMGRSTIGGIMLQVDNNSTTFDMRPADSDSGVTNAQIANSHILFSGTYITA